MLPISELDKLPKISGVYLVVSSNGKVIYIGQSKDICDRWKNGHHKFAEIVALYGIDVFIRWVQIPDFLLNRAENAAISFYKPILNKKHPPTV